MGVATLTGHRSQHPVRITTTGYTVQFHWSSVDVIVTPCHFVPKAPLSDHVRLLASVHLLRREADGGAGEGAQLAVPAVDALERVFFPNLAVHHSYVKGHRNPWAIVQRIAFAPI